MLFILVRILSQEPCNQVAKEDGIVHLPIILRTRNLTRLVQIPSPFPSTVSHTIDVQQNHVRTSLNQPLAKDNVNTV